MKKDLSKRMALRTAAMELENEFRQNYDCLRKVAEEFPARTSDSERTAKMFELFQRHYAGAIETLKSETT